MIMRLQCQTKHSLVWVAFFNGFFEVHLTVMINPIFKIGEKVIVEPLMNKNFDRKLYDWNRCGVICCNSYRASSTRGQNLLMSKPFSRTVWT
jgi:hypothetical protein